MGKVIVYRVRFYDISTDGWSTSRRMATAKGADIMGGEIIESSKLETDVSELEAGEEWTPRDYGARKHTGFQARVTA